ncbi:MAG TPA: GNAT family N-acetyltransferase, partial [Gaiellaceae bacterium]|nr:GNAT family N-acetyltransferase [Gaiellaceae bacterium]
MDPIAAHTGALRFSTVDDAAAFQALDHEQWDAMVEALPHPTPYLLHGWLAPRLRAVGAEPRIQLARRAGALVGALPLELSHRHGLRVAAFACGRHGTWPDVLLAAGEPEGTAYELVERGAASGQDVLLVHGLSPRSRIAGAASLELVHRIDAPVIDLSRGWEEAYRAKVSKRHRQDHRQKQRALSALGRLETRVHRSPAELAAVLDDTFRLHALRWAGGHDRYGYGGSTWRRFMLEAVEELGGRGQFRIVTVALD